MRAIEQAAAPGREGALGQNEALARVEGLLDRDLPRDRPVRVLEAGGGSMSYVKIPRPTHTVALDISPEQIAANDYADETILGDLQDPALLTETYDLVVCWNVLEHLPHPGRAFASMARCLAPGGFLLVGCPNLYSVKGAVTKFSPHWFHVWYYRRIRGDARAGEPGRAPFPTHLRSEMSFGALERTGRALGLEVAMGEFYTSPIIDELRERHPLLHALYRSPAVAARTLGAGRLRLDQADYVLLMRKPPEEGAGQRASA